MTRVVTTLRADDDILDAIAHYIASGSTEAAGRLVDELETAYTLLCERPSIGSTRMTAGTGLPDLRAFALNDFPYALFYSEDGDTVRVHRVLHTRRDVPAELTDF